MRLSVPLLALLLVLTGCSGSDGPGGSGEEAGPKAPVLSVPAIGQCVAKEIADGNDVAPDFTTVVPCTEPHVYEVIGVRAIPPRFLDRTTPQAGLARRTELATVGPRATRRSMNFQRVLWPSCDQALRVATGVDRFTFRGKDAKALRVNPVLRNAGPWLNLAPAKHWAKHPVVVCSVRYAGPTPKGAVRAPARPVESATKQLAIRSWMTPAFPLPFRMCASAKSGARVPCVGRHGAEYLVTADFKAAYGPDFLRGVMNLSALPEQLYGQVLDVCRRLYQQTGNRLPAGLRLNYRYHRTDDVDAQRLVMSCVVQDKGGKDTLTGFRSLG